MSTPLAERLRPKNLSDYIGQGHLVGTGAILSESIKKGHVPSIIFWGPPGVGKTTLARIIANEVKLPFYQLSAINSGVKDVRETIKKAEKSQFFDQPSPILFIDEIHRFSKSQQDSLLGAVEKGTITLIGATTENPSFEVISALLSRCQVYILNALDKNEMMLIADRAIAEDAELKKRNLKILEYDSLLKYANGDARRLLNVLEIISNSIDLNETAINNDLVEQVIQKNILLYDKSGEGHYDTISAFIKSVRGSDPDAAIYYLARMIAGGEDPVFICRRMVILAAEDIGLANPNALLMANACFDAVSKIGMPEGRIPMAQAAIYLATSPKSNSAYVAIHNALAEIEKSGNLSIPLHIRNAPTSLMKDLGYGKGYIYPHDQEVHEPYQYLPKELSGKTFYHAKPIGAEQKIDQALQQLRDSRKS